MRLFFPKLGRSVERPGDLHVFSRRVEYPDGVGRARKAESGLKFTVIIATRNRTELLPRSLKAVAAQTHADIELIVIDDSTTEETRAANAALVEEVCPGAMYLPMPEDQRGRGPGFPRNHGIMRASGDYIAFLDDDDEWIDPDNLSGVGAILERHGFDVHFTDQEAMLVGGAIYPPPVWTEDLGQKLPAAGLAPKDGSYLVPVDKMLLSDGFAHLNNTVVRRALLQDELQGFDLRITYEEDREIYFRFLDQAKAIGYTPLLVARHHIPAGANRPSASNNVPDEEKDASRLRYFDNLIASARLELVRERARRERIYTLKRIAQREAGKGNLAEARQFGAEALRSAFGYKWAAYMGWLWLRSVVSLGKSARSAA
jgi:glycosyltransferase involved in cell wall biosynthesis